MRAVVILCCLLLWGEAAYEQTLSLNGNWAFRTDPNDLGKQQGWFQTTMSTAGWDSLPVPGNWDLRNEWANYVGKSWYRRTVRIPAGPRGKTVRLCFEAVYHDAVVWLNGQKLGENHSGYLPFAFDVTDKLSYDGPNTLVVCADNTFRRGALWNWGGIRRSVTLEVTDAVRLVRQHITPVVDLNKRTATVTIRLMVQNHGAAAQAVRGEVRLSAPNGYEAALPYTANIPARQSGGVLLRASLSPKQLHLWHFDDPFLYTATAITTTGQTITDRFGLRKIEVDNKNYAFRLNGEAIRPLGFNLVPDDRTTGNTLPLWRIKEDIDKLKELGCTMARLTHLPVEKEALDYLDERGIMVFVEVPLWGFDLLAKKDHPLPTDWLTRLIERDYNHPSIIGWSVGNEIGDYPDAMAYVESAITRVRRLDPTRLAVMVSHSAVRNERDPLLFSDLGLINSYGRGIGQTADKIHQRYPDKVLFYTEYGYDQFTENGDGDLDAKAMLDSLRGKPYLIGGSLWTFNDYRSNYYGTKEFSQNRPWGVVDVFRQPKRAYQTFRREVAPIRAMRVEQTPTGATIVLTPRSVLDLPAYTLTKYRVMCKILDEQGRFLGGSFQNLSPIRPGDRAIRQAVQWPSTTTGSVQIALVSPLGYSVYDTTLFRQKPQPPPLLSVLGGRTEQNDPRPATGRIRAVFEPVPMATAYKIRYGPTGLTHETPLTRNSFADVPKLSFGQTYQVAVVAVNGAGESEPSNVQTVRVEPDEYPAPIIQHVEPADGGFFVGYATQVDDYLTQLEYTRKAGDYSDTTTIQTATKGVLFVPRLVNGQPYYFRLRYLKDNYFPTAWTAEHMVTPDGGQRPIPPTVQGVIRQANEAMVCFKTVKKAVGYTLEYRTTSANSWSSVRVTTAQCGLTTIAGLDPNQPYQFRLATLNAVGQSDFSPIITAQGDDQIRRN